MVLGSEDVKALFGALKATMDASRDELIRLDSLMGDGDLGLTMAAAFNAAWQELEKTDEGDPGKLFVKAGMAMAKAAPSTMGTLMATGFMRGGKAVKDQGSLGLPECALFWQGFVDGIMERGKAKPGDKTIIDSLYPAAESLKASQAHDTDLAEAFRQAVQAAEKGLEETKTMVAQFGRAAYYQEKSRELQDPGATVGVLLIRTFSDYIESALKTGCF